MKKVRDLLHRVADLPSHVLITRERETGKELVAKVLHHISRRRTASFVPVGCSALAAADGEGGLFNEAEKGTLFFDEIGELPELWQGKLVQAMEDIKVHRAGATTSPFADVRLVAATTVNLEHEVPANRFRGDLDYRLKVVEMDLPPLRDRRKAIPVLAEAARNRYAQEHAKPVRGISEAALLLLTNYSWPGNVWERESVLERAVTLSHASEILPGDLPAAIQQVGRSTRIGSNFVERAKTLKQVEEESIRLIVDKTSGNHSQAARMLGIDRRTRYRRLFEMENDGVRE